MCLIKSATLFYVKPHNSWSACRVVKYAFDASLQLNCDNKFDINLHKEIPHTAMGSYEVHQ